MPFLPGKCLLKQRLKEAGISQQELANRLKMPRTQVSDYANNRQTMSLKNAKSIAHVLDCYIDDLYEWTPVHPSNRSKHKE